MGERENAPCPTERSTRNAISPNTTISITVVTSASSSESELNITAAISPTMPMQPNNPKPGVNISTISSATPTIRHISAATFHPARY